MSTNLLRNAIFISGVLLLMCMGAFAYSSYKAATKADTAECYSKTSNRSSEMPWEALTSQLLGAVRL